jgi:hypothetical protein
MQMKNEVIKIEEKIEKVTTRLQARKRHGRIGGRSEMTEAGR